MKTMLIKCIPNGATEIIYDIPEEMPLDKVVTAYQKSNWRYLWQPAWQRKLPPVKYKLAEADDLVAALKESANF